MLGWFGDLGRLSWGYLYWNARKSLFRIRGATGAAPCHHPSDSGEAGRTGCEACLGWNDKRRFRRLCPLVAFDAGGRAVCSVAAPRVRPFWGRAAAHLAGLVAAVLIAGVLGAFASLRAVGYRVPLRVVAWPPAWHRIQTARAEYYLDMGLRALRAGDARKGYLALSHAYVLDPGNAAAARVLAQITQVASPDYSDEIYSRLLEGHGRDFEQTGEVWFRALLARGNLRGVADLSTRMLRGGAARVPAWTQGLLFAERMGAGSAEVDALLSGPGLPDEARTVLALAAANRGGTANERMRRLEVSLGGGSTAFEVYYALRCLTELGRAEDVVKFLEGPEGAAVLAYDREALKLDAYSSLGWDAVERREITALLEPGTVGPAVTLIAAHLVRHPNPGSARLAFSLVDAKPLGASDQNVGAHMALLCMAGANGLGDRVASQAKLLAGLVGGTRASWEKVVAGLGGPAGAGNPADYLPLLTELPLEVEYAVIERHHGASAPGP